MKEEDTVNFTESTSRYENLDQMPIRELLTNINNEDKTVPLAIEKVIETEIGDVEEEDTEE